MKIGKHLEIEFKEAWKYKALCWIYYKRHIIELFTWDKENMFCWGFNQYGYDGITNDHHLGMFGNIQTLDKNAWSVVCHGSLNKFVWFIHCMDQIEDDSEVYLTTDYIKSNVNPKFYSI